MRRVLIFSDSLAAPRNKGASQVLDYKETWPSLLRSVLPDAEVAQVSIGSATTEEILYQAQYWTGFDADVVIFQLGLCDCLPRALYPLELEIVKRMPFAEALHKWVAKHSQRLRELRAISWTSEEVFAERVSELGRLFPRSYWLSILVDNEREPVRFPRCAKLTGKYNRILKKYYGENFLDVTNMSSGSFMPDGFHLNGTGHRHLFNRITNQVLKGVIA